MALRTGQRLGHYVVIGPIGAALEILHVIHDHCRELLLAGVLLHEPDEGLEPQAGPKEIEMRH